MSQASETKAAPAKKLSSEIYAYGAIALGLVALGIYQFFFCPSCY